MIQLTLQFEVTLKESAQKLLADTGEFPKRSFAQILADKTVEYWELEGLVDDWYMPKEVIEVTSGQP